MAGPDRSGWSERLRVFRDAGPAGVVDNLVNEFGADGAERILFGSGPEPEPPPRPPRVVGSGDDRLARHKTGRRTRKHPGAE